MSLLDALLIEPYRDPREIWIAVRTDGVAGSGTIDDPFNAAVRNTPTVAISSITRGGVGNTEATVIAPGHGFTEGEMVTISGVTITQTTQGDVYYIGTFAIKSVTLNEFRYAMLFAPSSSSAPGAVISCWKEREQFDVWMRSVPENAVIHIGPGVFDTKGWAGAVAGGWYAKTGQKFTGSGIGITTLRIVGGSGPYSHYSAIASTSYADGFEVSDMTIDCNVDGQINSNTVCGAVAIYGGRHVRIRRVRAIHWGSRSPVTNAEGYVENFVFFIVAPGSDSSDVLAPRAKDGHDCVLEDCLAEQPTRKPIWNSFLMVVGGLENGNALMSYMRGGVIRNCWINAQQAFGPKVDINTITIDGTGLATVTTKWAHGRSYPGDVLIENALVGGSSSNAYNGVFGLETVVDANRFTFRPYENPGLPATGGTTGGRLFISIAAIKSNGITPVSGRTFDVETYTPHNCTTNSNVRVSGIVLISTKLPSLSFNGEFTVENIISSTKLRCTLRQDPDALLSDLNYGGAILNVAHHGIAIDGGTMAVAENNRLFHCWSAGPYHDFFSSRDSVVRSNLYYGANVGLHQNLGGASEQLANAIPALSLVHSGIVATFTVAQAHDLRAGEVVQITGSDVPDYNGLFEVRLNPTDTAFSYEMKKIPSGNATGSPGYRRFWQAGQIVLEKNLFLLSQNIHPLGTWQPLAARVANNTETFPAFPCCKRFIVDSNSVDTVNSTFDPNPNAFAFASHSCGHTSVNENIINLNQSGPIKLTASPGLVQENKKPDGSPIEGVSVSSADVLAMDDLSTRVDTAVLNAI